MPTSWTRRRGAAKITEPRDRARRHSTHQKSRRPLRRQGWTGSPGFYASPSVGGSSMRFARRFSVSTRWRARALPLCAALALGCHGEVGGTGTETAITPVCDPGDPSQVVESQRILLLTSTQIINLVKLVSPEEAQAVVDGMVFNVTTEFQARFPPAEVRDAQDDSELQRAGLFRRPGPSHRQLRPRPFRGGDPVRDARDGHLRARLARQIAARAVSAAAQPGRAGSPPPSSTTRSRVRS